MKIAILTSGILPVPAVQGGAVENLIDTYLAYNDQYKLHDITVYSVANPKVKGHPALLSDVNHYRYIQTSDVISRIRKRIHKIIKGPEYYHYSIEYYLQQAIKHLENEAYDIIILENRPGYVLQLNDKTSARFVYHLHNDFLNAQTPHAKKIYHEAVTIITVSDYIGKQVGTISSDDEKCVTVHNGIDLNAFSPSTDMVKSRSQMGLAPSDFVLVFSGRLTKEKGIFELIQAMKLLSDHPDIKLLVLGSSFYANDNRDNAFISELKQSAQSLDTRIFFTGFIPYDEMPAYLAMSDVAVIPSLWDDPFPTTVLEAQAMGLPVISTRRGGIPEEVSAENAILLDTDKDFVPQLAKAILQLHDNAEKRQEMAAASLRHAQQFSKESFARHFFQSLDKFTI